MSEPFKVKINPRWENAPFERSFVLADGRPFHVGYPLRFDSYDEGMEATGTSRGIPPFLKIFLDGRTEESF